LWCHRDWIKLQTMARRIAITVLLGSLVLPARATDLVDGVVAVVGDQPIMLSAVVFEHEVLTVLDGGGREVNLGPPQLDCAVFETVVDRTLVLQQADGAILGVDEEANWQMERFLDRFERVEDLTRWLGRWHIGTAELRAYFVSRVRADSLALARAETTTRLSEREVLDAYRSDPGRWAGAAFESVADDIRAELWRERLEEQRRRWIAGLRERHGVRSTELGTRLVDCGVSADGTSGLP